MEEYSLTDISAALDQKESTIRRWGKLLENAGYQFSKNERSRNYSESDLELFKKVKELTKGLKAELAVAVAFQLLQEPLNEKINIDLEPEILELDVFIQKFNSEYFWNSGQALQQLHQKWGNLKLKYRGQTFPADSDIGKR
ncbi:MerR family transcriptional regulator [Paenibacillus amylolyticus]|uniref:MerR family transcriptional regulator n=1 Tax=Paenibacillus amylolyticus TaxID=1451 RepID=A0ABD8B2V2_PAEAM